MKSAIGKRDRVVQSRWSERGWRWKQYAVNRERGIRAIPLSKRSSEMSDVDFVKGSREKHGYEFETRVTAPVSRS